MFPSVEFATVSSCNNKIRFLLPNTHICYRKCYTLRYFLQMKKEQIYIRKFGYEKFEELTPFQLRNIKV